MGGVIPSLYEAKNIPWVLPCRPSCVEEVVIVASRAQNNAVGLERVLPGNVVAEMKGHREGSWTTSSMATLGWPLGFRTPRALDVSGRNYRPGGGFPKPTPPDSFRLIRWCSMRTCPSSVGP